MELVEYLVQDINDIKIGDLGGTYYFYKTKIFDFIGWNFGASYKDFLKSKDEYKKFKHILEAIDDVPRRYRQKYKFRIPEDENVFILLSCYSNDLSAWDAEPYRSEKEFLDHYHANKYDMKNVTKDIIQVNDVNWNNLEKDIFYKWN